MQFPAKFKSGHHGSGCPKSRHNFKLLKSGFQTILAVQNPDGPIVQYPDASLDRFITYVKIVYLQTS